ncbi:succinylglutamate desuccinylase [bacterium]|nr:succinylglutamate desuccinylase [bacterium]
MDGGPDGGRGLEGRKPDKWQSQSPQTHQSKQRARIIVAEQQTLSVGGVEIAPGTQHSIDLPIAELYTGAPVTMPVRVLRGKRDGPVLFVSAAIHGDELNGVEIIRRVLRMPGLKRLRGTVIAVPIVNVHGFLRQSRYMPDRRDLNRSFPGSETGSVAARTAHVFLKEIVEKADFGIDLHTGAIHRPNLPQIRANLKDKPTLELAEAFAAPLVLDSPPADGTLRDLATSNGVPVLLYESGEALRFDEVAIRIGVAGVTRVLRHLGMLPATGKAAAKPTLQAASSQWLRAPQSGILRSLVKLGAMVEAGQAVAMVADPFGDGEVAIGAPTRGVVIGRLNLPVVHEGDAVCHLAKLPGDASAMAEQIVDYRSDYDGEPPAMNPEPPIA